MGQDSETEAKPERCRRHPQRSTETQFPVPRTTMAFAQNIFGCPEASVMGMIQSRAM